MEEKEKKPKILLVDDIIGNIKILIEILKPSYDISFVTSGMQALEIAQLEIPDLVLLIL
jgi:CheY-like chemotaxis protein